MIHPEFLAHVMALSGLSENTCKELLEAGWWLIDERDKPKRWEQRNV